MEPASTARARSAGLGTGRVRLVFLGSHDSSLCPDLLFLWHVFLCLCCQCRAGRNAVRNRSRRDLDNGLQHVGAAQLHHQVRLHGLNHRCAELPAGQYATRDRAQPGERYNLLPGTTATCNSSCTACTSPNTAQSKGCMVKVVVSYNYLLFPTLIRTTLTTALQSTSERTIAQ